MDSSRRLSTSFLSAALMLSSCADTRHEPGTPPVLATVNGASITADDLSAKLGDHDLSDATVKERALDAIIAEELMAQKAEQLGFDKDSRFQERIRAMEAKIAAYKRSELGRRVRDTQIASRLTVTDQEVRDHYAKHAEEIRTDLRLGVLELGSPAQANGALARIRAGTPFETIAAEQLPDAPHALSHAWDLGFQHWDQVPEPLQDAYRLKKGEIDVMGSASSKTYLVKVIDARENPDAGLERMKATIERRLWAAKGREAYERYIAQLKKDAAITRKGIL